MAMPPFDLTLFTHVLNSKTVTGDLNELTTSGFYYVELPVNAPTNHYPHLIVNANDRKDRIEQICFPDQGPTIWFRNKVNDTWSAWNQLATMDQVTNELTRLLTTVEF